MYKTFLFGICLLYTCLVESTDRSANTGDQTPEQTSTLLSTVSNLYTNGKTFPISPSLSSEKNDYSITHNTKDVSNHLVVLNTKTASYTKIPFQTGKRDYQNTSSIHNNSPTDISASKTTDKRVQHTPYARNDRQTDTLASKTTEDYAQTSIHFTSKSSNRETSTNHFIASGSSTSASSNDRIVTSSVRNPIDSTISHVPLVTSTSPLEKDVDFNVTTYDIKPQSIKLYILATLADTELCSQILVNYSIATLRQYVSTNFQCSSTSVNESIAVKNLDIGLCYLFEVTLHTTSGRTIGPYSHEECTKPKRPGKVNILQRNTHSLLLQVEHPEKGQFDSFQVGYKNSTDNLHLVTNRSEGNHTEIMISNLQPGDCYDIQIYSVSNDVINTNQRNLSNECLVPSPPGEIYSITTNQTSFMLSWSASEGLVDQYLVHLFCPSSGKLLHQYVNQTKMHINGLLPGDCCRVNVSAKNRHLFSTARIDYGQLLEAVPDEVQIESHKTSSTELNISWSKPNDTSGWIKGYTVELLDNSNQLITTHVINCSRQELNCSTKFDQQVHQCLKYELGEISAADSREGDFQSFNSSKGTLFLIIIDNLTPGTLYYYSITAYNRAGTSPPAGDSVITLEESPESPNFLRVRALDTASLIVTWMPPNITNGVIIEYTVQYGIDGTDYNESVRVGPNIYSVILTNLECWVQYEVCVSASTSVGTGPEICDTGIPNVYDPVSQIANVTMEGSDISLEFKVPCENVPINFISYEIEFVSLDHNCTGNDPVNVTQFTNCTSGQPCELTGLYSYWDYYIKVQEATENTDGPWSSDYHVKTLPDYPEEVRNLQVRNSTSESLIICWEKPCFVNGLLIGYNLTIAGRYSVETGLCATVHKLRPYTFYNVSVVTINNIGSSQPKVIRHQTDTAKPESPNFVRVRALDTASLNVTWMPPNTTNGVIIEYTVQYGIDGTVYNESVRVGPDIYFVILTNLECWVLYEVCVSASTSVGTGPEICDTGIPNVYYPMSENTSITVGGSNISLEFKLPCGNVPITFISYQIEYVFLNHTCTSNDLVNMTQYKECFSGQPCELTSLYSYWDYYIKVQEATDNTVGPWSDVILAKTLPDYPEEVRNLQVRNSTSESLIICWEKPCFFNGLLIGYNLTIAGRSSMETGPCATVHELQPYTYYNVSVFTVNNIGGSQPKVIRHQTEIARPSRPTNISLIVHAEKITVSWSPITPYPGPTDYRVEVINNQDGSTKYCFTSAYNSTTCTVDDLEEYWMYNLTVTAHTSMGSNRSLQYQTHTKQAAPGPVTDLSVKPETNPDNPRQIYVSFGPPSYRDRNGLIQAYYIRCSLASSQEVINVVKVELNDIETDIVISVPHQVLLNISVFGETIDNGTEVSMTVLVPKGASKSMTTEALAGFFAALIVFGIAAVIIVVFYKKEKLCFKPRVKEEIIQLKAVTQLKKKEESEDKRKNRPVKVDRFYQHVEIMARDSNYFFSKEYKELKAMAPTFSTEVAEQQEARTKNRYSNILPFDHSRVKILPLDDEEGSDYINANYIPGYNSKREYIATQGPLSSTKDDFWRMVWEQNVSVIVMLTQCVERGKRKCECYWPECVKEPIYYGDLCIEIENESHLPEYVLRTVKITLGNVSKLLMHFLYLAWPDMGVPASTDNMISLVKTVRSHVNPNMKGPITVHCSAGVGRTGTFIAVDILLHQLDNDCEQIDIFGDVLKLRNHRCNMVQTEDQYVFIHHCISDYILAMCEDTDEEEAMDGGDEPMYQNVPGR